MWTKEITDMIINGVWATLYMTVASTVLGYVFGLPMGVLLAITDKEGLTPNAVVYKILDVIANIVRRHDSRRTEREHEERHRSPESS